MRRHLLFTLIAAVLVLLPSAVRAQLLATSSGTRLWGNVIYCQSWDENENITSEEWPVGIYSFKPVAPSITNAVYKDRRLNANGGGFYRDGKFCFFNYQNLTIASTLTYYEVDVTKKEFTKVVENIEDKSLRATDLTYDRTTGNVYGQFYRKELGGRCIGVLDTETMSHSNIINTTTTYVSMAVDKNGKLYAISQEGDLYAINKTTGEQTKIGATGVKPGEYRMSATFDWTTNILYWSCVHNDEDVTSALYTVDTTTGQATKVMDFRDKEQIVGLYTLPPAAADGAPAKADPVGVSFMGGDNTGKISFTAPTKTFDGKELSGSIDYVVLDNGNELLTGTTEPGTVVERDITVDKGEHIFSVYTKNAYGKSEESDPTRQWVGYDNPKAVNDLKAAVTKTADKTKVHITWTPNYVGVHDGFVWENDMTYTVTRLPDGKTVATGITECSADDEIDNNSPLMAYSYKVVPYNDKMVGEEATTETVTVGSAKIVPYDETFELPNSFELFTVIDANNDDKTWYYDDAEKAACYRYSVIDDADDWLLTPQLKLEKDKSYVVRFTARCAASYAPEVVEIAAGEGDIPTTYINILPATTIEHDAYGEHKTTFTPVKDGNYRIGFHAVSPANRFKLFIKGIHVAEDTQTGINALNSEGLANGKAVFFDLCGRKGNTPHKGINIIRMNDGSVKKVVIK